jgi:DUF4097 and DUF4098 domain-containing protein YvlB
LAKPSKPIVFPKILDSIIETVNGNIVTKAAIQNYGISLVNGDVKLTAGHDSLQKIKASSVNGNGFDNRI